MNLFLEYCQSFKKFKKYNLIFKIIRLYLKSYFLFIIFINAYLIININKI